MQFFESTSSTLLWLWLQIASLFTLPPVTLLIKHLYEKRKKRLEALARSPKTAAEARQLDGTTVREAYEEMRGLHSVIRDLNIALAKELRRADRAELERETLEGKLAQANSDVETTDLFMRQMRAACHLAEVQLADYLPADIKKAMDEMGIGYHS